MTDFENHVIDSLGRIETKLDTHKEVLADHEKRIRRGERVIYGLTAIGTAVLAVFEAAKLKLWR